MSFLYTHKFENPTVTGSYGFYVSFNAKARFCTPANVSVCCEKGNNVTMRYFVPVQNTKFCLLITDDVPKSIEFQSDVEIEFCNINTVDTLPESKIYIVPSISGFEVMDVDKYKMLIRAAQDGATVIFTADSGYLQPFEEYFNCTVDYRTEAAEKQIFILDGKEYATNQKITRRMIAKGCEVLASDPEGNPVIMANNYGKGKLIFVNAALEENALEPDNDLYLVYRKLAALAGLKLPDKSKDIGITYHTTIDNKTLKFYINYSDKEADGILPNSVKYEIY
jgi:hypothetical protein